MRDLLSAIAFMHYNHIIHCDIKMENIRFLKTGDVPDHIKLFDLGSAKFHQRGSDQKHFDMAGSPYYCSPEMLVGTGYNEKTDVWSAGIIFHKLLTGCFPFDGKTDMDIVRKCQKTEINLIGKRYALIDPASKMLLKKLLTKDPLRRPSASDARRLPYFY